MNKTKSQKDMMKALETPEEKRLRRFLKKEAKEKKRMGQMEWDKDYMGYTNTDNPFGDANLLKPFVWDKKLEKEGLKSLAKDDIEKRNRSKLMQNKIELEKVKTRRLEREREREAREEDFTKIQREKEAAHFKEWEKQEDVFHLQQIKIRSKIRIQEGRAKPIDFLASYISVEEEDFALKMNEPYTHLSGLKIHDLEDLMEDIKTYMELENGQNFDYWKDLQIMAEDEIHKLRKLDSSGSERRDGINSAVVTEALSIFKGKTPNQLRALHQQIEQKISNADENVDVGYWETLLSRLKAYMARARLRERHQDNLRHKLYQLREAVPSVASACSETFTSESTSLEECDPIKQSEADYLSGRYSPQLISTEQLESGILLISLEEDSQKREIMQRRIKYSDTKEGLSAEEQGFEKVARTGMDADEAVFSVEFPLERAYLWSDKYRPRKPKYLNRVHTGFEWNKYNQTHYDMDNPPPKIVQGYKFHVLYPDLIDQSKAPEYTLTPCDDNKEFSILRFHAGPPYEDIAFKVVNREWECSRKRGFMCQFHNNIFKLWFHFKRYRYRR